MTRVFGQQEGVLIQCERYERICWYFTAGNDFPPSPPFVWSLTANNNPLVSSTCSTPFVGRQRHSNSIAKVRNACNPIKTVPCKACHVIQPFFCCESKNEWQRLCAIDKADVFILLSVTPAPITG